jgi:hypothetical protein
MAISQTACTSFKQELAQGVHNFGPTSPDVFKLALYTGLANLNANTTVYVTADQVVGPGYSAGGNTLTISQAPIVDTTTGVAYWSFANTSWPASSFTARGALIYNSSKGNKAVAVLDFGADKTSNNSTFTVQFPVVAANTAILRIK